ncbi:hypothetical protein FB451DRAFT_1188642 [Mycena latifolia]|nr:hypothetical protein FB451DRAFT_1188642 [Mycena latifolia]
MFRQGFVPVVLAAVGIGLKIYRMAWVDPPMGPLVESFLASCTYSTSTPLRGFLCVLEPYFKHLVSNDIGKSLLTVCGTFGMVMSTHFHLTAGQWNAPPLFSPLITIATTLLGQGYGAGITGPILLPALLAISKTLQPTDAAPPTPSPFPYTVTVLGMHFAVFLLSGSITGIPTSSTAWSYANCAFQLFPLLLLPLTLFPRATAPPANEPTPTLTASVFKVYKYLYTPLWWISVAQGLNAYYRQNEPFSLPCYFLAVDFAGMVLTFLGMYAIDYVAGDTARFSVSDLVLRLALMGPTAAMAAYYEAKERWVIEHAVGKEKVL